MFKTIFIGASTAYVTKVVQMLVQFLIVPFLISEKQLGLAGYGSLFSILSLQFLLGMFTDGIRLSISKNVSQCVDDQVRQFQSLISATLFIGLSSAILLFIALSVKKSVISLFGLSYIADIEQLYFLTCLCFLIEQSFFPIETVLHSKGQTWIVNMSISGEVVIRTLAVFLVFIFYNGNIKNYIGIFFLCLCFRKAFLLIIVLKNQSIYLFTDSKFIFHEIKDFIKDALPLSLKGISSVLVYRGSVLLTNRVMGPEAAGLLTILVINIRGYIAQGLLAMLRPMVIPLTASLNLNSLDEEKQETIKSALGMYQLFVGFVCIGIGLSSPTWMHLWLGDNANNLVNISPVFIIAIGLEIAFSIQSYLLVSQGYGLYLSIINTLLSVVFFVLMLFLFYFKANLFQIIWLISLHSLVDGAIVVHGLFKNKLRKIAIDKFPISGLFVSVLIASVPAILFKIISSSHTYQWQLISLVSSLILFTVSFHYIVFSIYRIKQFLLSSVTKLMK